MRSPRAAGRAVMVLALCALGGVCAVVGMGAEPALPAAGSMVVLGLVLLIGGCLLAFPEREGRQGQRHIAGPTLLSPVLFAGGSAGALHVALRSAVGGVGAGYVMGLLIAVATGSLLVQLHRIAQRLGWCGSAWYRSPGLWLLLLGVAIQMPLLGGFGLIDPWETHYGEVAREILERDDWISLWWAQEGWFWSKPVLDFWLQALAFAALDVPSGADQMLAAVHVGHAPRPEWAARLPVLGAALIGQAVLYLGVRSCAGRRMAGASALLLLTAPYWVLLSRQSMVDMLYVGPFAAGVGLLLVALRAQPDTEVRSLTLEWRRVRFTFSAFHLALGVLLLTALPQISYLVSRNASFHWQDGLFGFRFHPDSVRLGSPGNCGLPGNAACSDLVGASLATLQPIHSAMVWLVALLVLAISLRRERRLKALAYLGAWWFTAVSFLGKGAPGLVLILFILLSFVVATGRYRELRHARLGGLVLLLACVAAPWFVQATARHGFGFVERLFIHDMVKRAFSHVHDTNRGDDTSFRYYWWQLGYGLFPWTGLAVASLPVVLRRLVRRPKSADSGRIVGGRQDALLLCCLGVLGAFAMFSITGTKFHHYILPLVPLLAVLVAGGIEVLWRGSRDPSWFAPFHPLLTWLGVAVAVLGLCVGATEALRIPGGVFSQLDSLSPPAFLLAVVAGAPWVASFGTEAKTGSRWRFGTALTIALVTAALGRDLVHRAGNGDVEGQLRLLHLFTYNYERPWPKELDFRPELTAITLVALVLSLMIALPNLRRLALRGFVVLAVFWAGWLCDVYLVQAAPHWGQRELIESYYRARSGPEEPLVAYQLNWKGENFYTGNHVPAFTTSGQKFKDWVKEQRERGITTLFFVTEHTRLRTLERELGVAKESGPVPDERSDSLAPVLETLTGPSLNNKFGLFRVHWGRSDEPPSRPPESAAP